MAPVGSPHFIEARKKLYGLQLGRSLSPVLIDEKETMEADDKPPKFAASINNVN